MRRGLSITVVCAGAGCAGTGWWIEGRGSGRGRVAMWCDCCVRLYCHNHLSMVRIKEMITGT